MASHIKTSIILMCIGASSMTYSIMYMPQSISQGIFLFGGLILLQASSMMFVLECKWVRDLGYTQLDKIWKAFNLVEFK